MFCLYLFNEETLKRLSFLATVIGGIFALYKWRSDVAVMIYLYRKHFVKKDEFNTLSYEIDRSLFNPQMQDYLYNLMMYAKAKGLSNLYEYLVEYGVEQKLLDHRFAEKGSAREHRVELKFHHYYEKWLAEEDEDVKKNY